VYRLIGKVKEWEASHLTCAECVHLCVCVCVRVCACARTRAHILKHNIMLIIFIDLRFNLMGKVKEWKASHLTCAECACVSVSVSVSVSVCVRVHARVHIYL